MSFWYLATPYSKHPRGLDAAFIEACRVAGRLIRDGVGVVSPIAHTHPIAMHCGMDPLDHSIWLPADRPIMEAAHGLMIAKMDGWQESVGIEVERKIFEAAGKPIKWVDL